MDTLPFCAVLVVGLGSDFRWAGTLRLMFSRASRLSAWKSGWRKVQLCGADQQRGKRRKDTAYMLSKLVIIRVLYLVGER